MQCRRIFDTLCAVWYWPDVPSALSIFAEGTWTVIGILAEHGPGAFLGPFGAIPVAGVRAGLVIREQHERELRKFRRSDIDKLLDLSDNLIAANNEAKRLREALDAIVEASSPI